MAAWQYVSHIEEVSARGHNGPDAISNVYET
jgi:hypothetical protein